MTKTTLLVSLILLTSSFFNQISAQSATDNLKWTFDSIYIPLSKTDLGRNRPIVIAVVDDAFNFGHKELKGFIFKNPKEVSGNQLDDDGNNYIDDISGWDISDQDNDVSVCEGRENQFSHGTYIASIISKISTTHYGDKANKRIKIMPIKVLSDQAKISYLKDGYKGIKYAIDNGADIVCMAWSGGTPGTEELKILAEADKKGIFLVGAAGNFKSEDVLFPASNTNVFAVAGIDGKMQKELNSNYGMQIDISAPAEEVLGAHPAQDNAYFQLSGTSAATAMVAACAAIVLSKKDGLSHSDVKEILMNSATPFKKNFPTYGGKMGAGILNLEAAILYLSQASMYNNSSLRSKGTLVFNSENASSVPEVSPAGAYHGYYLEPDVRNVKKVKNLSFRILVKDTVWNAYQLASFPPKIFVPSGEFKVDFPNNKMRTKDVFKIHYYGKTVDSTTLFCSGLKYLNNEKGSVDDGSGVYNYTNNCSGRWLITIPPGKRIKFTFDKMNTQGNVDFVYLVDGETAIPENIFAKFSGHNKPPVVTSRTNKVLVWFVTDKSVTGKGWRCSYEAVE